VYTWGSEASLGQMGFRAATYTIEQPQRVPDLEKGISRVYTGSYFSFIVYDDSY